MLMPGAFPILDFDDDPDDLISPMMFADVQVEGPGVAVLAFLSEKTIETAEGWEVRRGGTVPFVTVEYPIYEATRSGQAVRVAPMPIGAAAAALVTERMIRSGADSLVAVGSCGALRKLPEGEFVVPSRALRDEGTSYHYLKAGAWVETDEALRATVAKVARSAGFGAQVAPVWTTDGFFRETRALVEQRKSPSRWNAPRWRRSRRSAECASPSCCSPPTPSPTMTTTCVASASTRTMSPCPWL